MSNPATRLLDRLEGVRRTGEGRWMARCPAHEDRRPSLSIRECQDGRVLIYDFAGCAAVDVVAAVGLDLASARSRFVVDSSRSVGTMRLGFDVEPILDAPRTGLKA